MNILVFNKAQTMGLYIIIYHKYLNIFGGKNTQQIASVTHNHVCFGLRLFVLMWEEDNIKAESKDLHGAAQPY